MTAMSDTETQRMILQRVDPGAAPSETAAGKVEADPQVALIERASPSSMLVEGRRRRSTIWSVRSTGGAPSR